LRELARLAADIRSGDLGAGPPAERLRMLVEHAAGLRAVHPPSARTVDDLGDPYGGPPEEFRRVAQVIQTAVRDILRPLTDRS
jgi:protein-tyrosine-phosphatase